jgi:hypothetical protein
VIEFKRKYKDLPETLKFIRLQVLQSLKFADETLPNFQHPAELYRYLKDRTTYKNDPPGVELLQTMPTLINGDYWGTPGAGDCDCFTITTLACCDVLGWKAWYKLAGRSLVAPVHIWGGVDWKGEQIALDLTEKQVGAERVYKFVQKINFVSLIK